MYEKKIKRRFSLYIVWEVLFIGGTGMDIKSFWNQYKYYVLSIAAGLIVFKYLFVSFINQPEETMSFEYSEDTEDISESAA